MSVRLVRGPREVNKTKIHTYIHTYIQYKPRNVVTGKDSPVRAASSTSTSRQSAGTADPDASRTMSPRIVHSVVHSLLNTVVLTVVALTVALVVVRRACQNDE